MFKIDVPGAPAARIRTRPPRLSVPRLLSRSGRDARSPNSRLGDLPRPAAAAHDLNEPPAFARARPALLTVRNLERLRVAAPLRADSATRRAIPFVVRPAPSGRAQRRRSDDPLVAENSYPEFRITASGGSHAYPHLTRPSGKARNQSSAGECDRRADAQRSTAQDACVLGSGADTIALHARAATRRLALGIAAS
jgi:hypothetical protein